MLAKESQGKMIGLREDILLRNQEIAVLPDFLAKAGAYEQKNEVLEANYQLECRP